MQIIGAIILAISASLAIPAAALADGGYGG